MSHVVYCFDANYQQHFAASISSLVDHYGDDPASLTVHVITDSQDPTLDAFAEDFSTRKGVNVRINRISDDQISFLELVPRKYRDVKDYINISTYFRILIPNVISDDVDKIVYIDSDTVILSDLSELFSYQMNGKSIGAVLDIDDKINATRHGLSHYFNAGVLLMDLSALRSKKFTQKCIEYMSSEDCDAILGDQCAINIVMQGDIKPLPRRWNRYVTNFDDSISRARDVFADAAIIHFITGQKPWHAWYENELGEHYWSSLRASQWPNPVLKSPRTFGEHHRMARKLTNQGQYPDAVSIYETLVGHLMKKAGDLPPSA